MNKLCWLILIWGVAVCSANVAEKGSCVAQRTALYAAGLGPAVSRAPKPVPVKVLTKILAYGFIGLVVLLFFVLAIGVWVKPVPSDEDDTSPGKPWC